MDNNDCLIVFLNEQYARSYLYRHYVPDNDIKCLELFYRTECFKCREDVIVKVKDAKIENGVKSIEHSNCKKIRFEMEEKR